MWGLIVGEFCLSHYEKSWKILDLYFHLILLEVRKSFIQVSLREWGGIFHLLFFLFQHLAPVTLFVLENVVLTWNF
jgi:hypothetical protein